MLLLSADRHVHVPTQGVAHVGGVLVPHALYGIKRVEGVAGLAVGNQEPEILLSQQLLAPEYFVEVIADEVQRAWRRSIHGAGLDDDPAWPTLEHAPVSPPVEGINCPSEGDDASRGGNRLPKPWPEGITGVP